MNERNAARIAALRTGALDAAHAYSEFYLYYFRRFAANEALGRLEDRYADAYSDAFWHMTPVIDDGELIVGKAATPLNEEQKAEWKTLRENVAEKIVRFAMVQVAN